MMMRMKMRSFWKALKMMMRTMKAQEASTLEALRPINPTSSLRQPSKPLPQNRDSPQNRMNTLSYMMTSKM
jgi:hypothetical protein